MFARCETARFLRSGSFSARAISTSAWASFETKSADSAASRMLRPGGQVVHIDFQKRELPIGPPLGMKIAREDLVKQMEGAGFRLAAEHTFLPYQYFLVFTPAGVPGALSLPNVQPGESRLRLALSFGADSVRTE